MQRSPEWSGTVWVPVWPMLGSVWVSLAAFWVPSGVHWVEITGRLGTCCMSCLASAGVFPRILVVW